MMDCTPRAAMVFTHRVGGDSQPDEIALVISDVILKMTTDDSRTTSNHVFSFVRRFDTANSVLWGPASHLVIANCHTCGGLSTREVSQCAAGVAVRVA